jgi:hypothetical protein
MTYEQDTLKSHYEFDYGKAKPNRFAARLTEDSLMVVLDPDVAAVFPTSEAVNDSLRVLAAAVQNLPNAKPQQLRKQLPAAPHDTQTGRSIPS